MTRPAVSSSLAAPPAGEVPLSRCSAPERATDPGFAVVLPDDTGTDLEDELLDVSPLPKMISPLPDSDAGIPVSPSQYLEPLVPTPADPATTSQLDYAPIWVGNALPTHDVFPSYPMSPECYAPATSPVTMDMPDTSEYISPGSPTAMDRILADQGDLLLDCSSNLPMLPLPLLPLPTSSVLTPEPVMAPSVAASPDLSREGPFDVGQSASVSGTGSGLRAAATSPAFPGIRRGSRIGASPEPPSGVLATPYGPGGGCVGCPTATA